jgi:hypothetical protein
VRARLSGDRMGAAQDGGAVEGGRNDLWGAVRRSRQRRRTRAKRGGSPSAARTSPQEKAVSELGAPQRLSREEVSMRLSFAIRAALIAFTLSATWLATAYADYGAIRFNVIKAGFVIGGSAGRGTLVFHGRYYPIAIGGVSYGFTFGASATDFVGRVSNIRTPSDVNGVYGAAGAGVAIGPGAGAIVLANQNGAVLTLSGRQAGLIVAADLNGLIITLR